jgi:outer membrane protein TolC
VAGGGRVVRLTLDQSLRMGVASNLTLQAGAFDPCLARAVFDVEVAAFDTLLTAGVSYSHTETPSTSAFFGRDVVTEDGWRIESGVQRRLATGGTVSFLYRADRLTTDSAFVTRNPSWTQSATVEATHPLLRGAGERAIAEIRRARNGVAVASENQRALVERVLLDVATAYWELVYAQEQVLSLRKAENVAGELLHDADARLEARVGTPLDVAEARAGLEQRRGERITAEGAREAAADRLRMLILPFGSSAENGVGIVAVDDAHLDRGHAPGGGDLERHFQAALATRPEVRASLADLANRRIDVGIAADAVKPQLDLVARASDASLAGGLSDSLGDLFRGEALSLSIGVEFSMYIGRRAARANQRLAEWARRQAVLRHKELENQILGEVRAGARDVETARAREAAGAAEVQAADEGLQGERDRLGQGKSTPFRVLEKEQAVTDARTRAARAAADMRIAEARFWRALGMLAQTYGVRTEPGSVR